MTASSDDGITKKAQDAGQKQATKKLSVKISSLL